MELGEHAEQQRDADGDRGRGDQQPEKALPAAAQGKLQAEPRHRLIEGCYSKRTLPGDVMRRSSGSVTAITPKATARPMPISA